VRLRWHEEIILVAAVFFVTAVVNHVAEQLLKWIEPHFEKRTYLSKSVDVLRIVVALTDDLSKKFREIIAVFAKWVVLVALPELPKVVCDIVDFINSEVSDTYLDLFFQLETCTVALINDDRPWRLVIVTSVRKFKTEQLY
jgi:hypothetical protein